MKLEKFKTRLLVWIGIILVLTFIYLVVFHKGTAF